MSLASTELTDASAVTRAFRRVAVSLSGSGSRSGTICTEPTKRFRRLLNSTAGDTITSLRESVRTCRGCGLFRNATQAVFGEGPAPARLLIVGVEEVVSTR